MKTTMNAKQIIAAAGGTKRLMELTGLGRSNISHWRRLNYIPRSWLVFLKQKFPEIRKAELDLAHGYTKKQNSAVENSNPVKANRIDCASQDDEKN